MGLVSGCGLAARTFLPSKRARSESPIPVSALLSWPAIERALEGMRLAHRATATAFIVVMLVIAACGRRPLAEHDGNAHATSDAGPRTGAAGAGDAGAGGGGAAAGGGDAGAGGGGAGAGGGHGDAAGEAGSAGGAAGDTGAAGGAGGAGGMAGAATGRGGASGAPACTWADCRQQPQARTCVDDSGPAFVCTRDADGACRWHAQSCTPRCTEITGVDGCAKVVGCFALILGCNDPRAPGTLCVPEGHVFASGGCDRLNCPGGGESPDGCRWFAVDSCTLATGRFAPDCVEKVCRDRSVVICLDRLR